MTLVLRGARRPMAVEGSTDPAPVVDSKNTISDQRYLMVTATPKRSANLKRLS
jgi:hypothetical protein